jgi:pantoate--beta-alanine ligase
MASRNEYLSADEREQALALSRALEAACESLAWGECDARALEVTMAQRLDRPLVATEYAVVVDEETLEPLETVDRPARALIAARVGSTRLIDNAPLRPARESRG